MDAKTDESHGAVAGQVKRSVRPVAGAVLARDGQPTLIVRGNEDAYVRHAGASYLYSQQALDDAVAAERERCAKMIEDYESAGWHGGSGYHAGLKCAVRLLRV